MDVEPLLDVEVVGKLVELELVVASAPPLVVNVVTKELVNEFELEFALVCVLLVTTLVTVGLVDKAEFDSNPASTIIVETSGSHEAEVKAGIILVSIKVTPGSNEENRFDIKYYNYNYYRTSHLNYSQQFELLIDSKFYLYEWKNKRWNK